MLVSAAFMRLQVWKRTDLIAFVLFFLSLNCNKENNVVTFSHSQTDNETNFFQLQTKKKKNNPLSRTVELKLN